MEKGQNGKRPKWKKAKMEKGQNEKGQNGRIGEWYNGRMIKGQMLM